MVTQLTAAQASKINKLNYFFRKFKIGDRIRALEGGELASGSVSSDEIANGAVIEAKLGTGAVTSGKLGSGAVTTAKLGDLAVTGEKISILKSAEQTGNGSEQDITHTLGRVPLIVLPIITELPADLAAGADFTEGTHTTDTIKITATTGVKYRVVAF